MLQDDTKGSEKLSQETVHLFFEILDNLDAIIFVADIESHTIIYANKYARNLLGNITGKTCWKALRGSGAEPCPFCTTKYFIDTDSSPHGSLNYEIQNALTHGWYDVHERHIETPDGQTLRLHLAIDITDKKKVDEQLKKSEEKYRTVADYTYDWECWLNEKREFEYISPSCYRITGYRAEDFFADHSLLEKIIHPADKAAFLNHQEEAFQSTSYSHIEYRIVSRQGKTKWISHYCQPVYAEDGSFWGRRSSNRDITERKEAEQKKKLNEQRLSILISLYEKRELDKEDICDFVLESSLPITLSTTGFLGFINEDESVMAIHTWSEHVMQECAIHNKPMEFYVCDAGMWGEAVRKKQPVMVNDFALDSPLKKGMPEGHVAINRFLAVPLVSNNKVISIIAVGNKEEPYSDDDIAQLKLLLQGMWQILQRKEAEDKLYAQSEKIRHFANAIAHDLKNPAISIFGLARMLRDRYGDKLDERALKCCEQIMKSSEQISSLAEDINSYITTRDTRTDFETLIVQDLWKNIRQEFLLDLEARSITWIEPDMEPVTFVGSRIGMLRIFRNLVENALKYGGENLSEIIVGYELADNHHVLTVENDGDRIGEEDKQVIFREFERKTKNAKIYGTGLGLAIVKEIALKHKGKSWLLTGYNDNPVFCVSISRNLST